MRFGRTYRCRLRPVTRHRIADEEHSLFGQRRHSPMRLGASAERR